MFRFHCITKLNLFAAPLNWKAFFVLRSHTPVIYLYFTLVEVLFIIYGPLWEHKTDHIVFINIWLRPVFGSNPNVNCYPQEGKIGKPPGPDNSFLLVGLNHFVKVH